MTNTPRKRRSTPKRTQPNRASTSAKTAKAATNGPNSNGAYLEAAVSDVEAAVSDALADAVRLGYHVLAENLEQGRVAAKQFRVGDYGARNVPSDVSQLAQRMMRLARDLSLTTFDLLDKLMRDPTIVTAARRMVAEAVQDGSKPVSSAKPQTVDSSKVTASKPNSPEPFVPLACAFSKDAKASTKSAWLVRPPSPTLLSTVGLTTLAPGVPAIGGITFRASDDGHGVIAVVPIPAQQPAGLYSGAVVNAESGEALGALTIQVGA